MVIELKVQFELPDDDFGKFSNAELSQILFDSYVNYVTISHFKDALEYYDTPSLKHISEYHRLWGNMTCNSKFTFECFE